MEHRTRTQIIYAAVTGLLVMFSFPTVLFGWHAPNLGFMIWFALVPLFFAISNETPKRAFVLTFISSSIWYMGSIYWIFRAMHTFGKLGVGASVAVLLLLVIIVAAYISLAPMLARFIETRWRGEFMILLPCAWVLFELLRRLGPFGGFPWADLSVSQWQHLYMIQIADVTGILGIVFVIVLVNAFLAEVVLRITGREVKFFFPKLIVAAAILIIVVVYGYFRLEGVAKIAAASPTIHTGIVQGSIPQDEKWQHGSEIANVNIYRRATRKLAQSQIDLIVWPESAFPWKISANDEHIDPNMLGFERGGTEEMPYLLAGMVTETGGNNIYNSAQLFKANGDRVARYDKVHLVPFGEYVPYKNLLFFINKLVDPVGDFQPGKTLDPIDSPLAKLAVLICYEDVFPEIARGQVLRGADLITNITNDAWYGVSSAPYQHVAHAVFRAVENRRFLVRAANTGVSAIVDPTGKIIVSSKIFNESILAAPVGLISELTFYTKSGEWFAYACIAYLMIGLGFVLVRRLFKKFGSDV